MTMVNERPVLGQGDGGEVGDREVAEAFLGLYGAEAPAVLRQLAGRAAERGRDNVCDNWLMFAEEADKLLAGDA